MKNGYYYSRKGVDPRKALAERWHMEADEHPGRDGLTLLLVVSCLFGIFVIIGFGLAMHNHAEAEVRSVEVEEVKPMAAVTDIEMSEKEKAADIREASPANAEDPAPAEEAPEDEEAPAEDDPAPTDVDEPDPAEETVIVPEGPDIPEGPVVEPVETASGGTATTLTELLGDQGRSYDGNGTSYTWYEHDLGWGPLDIPGEWFDSDGVSHDSDGYIVVASDDHDRGTVLDTPYGQAKVYDKGSGYGNVDIYTNR